MTKWTQQCSNGPMFQWSLSTLTWLKPDELSVTSPKPDQSVTWPKPDELTCDITKTRRICDTTKTRWILWHDQNKMSWSVRAVYLLLGEYLETICKYMHSYSAQININSNVHQNVTGKVWQTKVGSSRITDNYWANIWERCFIDIPPTTQNHQSDKW